MARLSIAGRTSLRIVSSLQSAAQLALATFIGVGLWGCSGDVEQQGVVSEDAGIDSSHPMIEGGPDIMIEGGPDIMIEGGPDVTIMYDGVCECAVEAEVGPDVAIDPDASEADAPEPVYDGGPDN
jgi:hypothetical protein